VITSGMVREMSASELCDAFETFSGIRTGDCTTAPRKSVAEHLWPRGARCIGALTSFGLRYGTLRTCPGDAKEKVQVSEAAMAESTERGAWADLFRK